MEAYKRMMCCILAIVLVCVCLPVSYVFGASSDSVYVVWDCNPDLIISNENNTVDAVISAQIGKPEFNTVKGYGDDKGSFCTQFSLNDKGGENHLAVIKSPFTYESTGFGWMSKSALLQTVSPYLYFSFDYFAQADEQLPDDTKLTVCIGNASDSTLNVLASVPVSKSGEWTQYKNTLVAETLKANWNSGFISYYLSSESKSFVGNQTVKIKNLKLSLYESDRLTINAALASVSGIKSIQNFSAGVSLSKDKKKNSDYFKLLITYDKKSALSENLSDSVYRISIENSDLYDISVSQAVAKGTGEAVSSDTVAVHIKPAQRYKVVSVNVCDKDGNIIQAAVSVKDEEYSFTMPVSDVTVSAIVKYEEKRDTVLLWYCNPANETTSPWYNGTRPYIFDGVTGNESQSLYKFTLNSDLHSGSIIVYGNKNNNVTPSLYLENAEFVFDIKLETKTKNKTVYIGTAGCTKKYAVTLKNDGFNTVRIPLSEIADGLFTAYVIYTDALSEGDVITVGDACLWSCETGNNSEYQMFTKMFDLSGYTKSDTNTLISTVGNPEAAVNPYNAVRPPLIAYELAWYTDPFQNASPWFVYPNENYEKGNRYGLAFYVETHSDGITSFDISEYVDTGYIEFYIKCENDGITVPFAVCSIGSKSMAAFTVKYDSKKARKDGYMQVRVPFTYLEDMGLNMTAISVVEMTGAQDFTNQIFLSSFRFYTNLADVPDPEPIVDEDETPDERDMPIELDVNVLNAYLDKENEQILIPYGAKMWELLAALKFDTADTTVSVFDGEDGVYEDDTLLTENMHMKVYRRGFFLGAFQFYYLNSDDLKNMPADIAAVLSKSPIVKTESSYDEYIDDDGEDDYEDGDDVQDETPKKKKKKIIKVIKKKNSGKKSDIIGTVALIAGGSLIVVAAVLLIIFRKKIHLPFKRKQGGKNQ